MTEARPDPAPVRVGTSVVTYRFGGREYPMKTVARCLSCQSPFRFEIETAIVQGRTYRKIAEMLVGYGEEYAISHEAISEHYRRGHMPLQVSDTRAIVEARARAVGRSIDEGIESLVDGVTLLNTVVAKTFEAIASGDVAPEVRDGIRAAKMLADLGEYDGSNVDQQAFTRAFIEYHQTASRLMDDEQFRRFGAELEANPVLAALAARYEGEDPDTVEGQVVSEANGSA